MKPLAIANLRELFLAHDLRRLARKCGVTLKEPLRIDTNGEINITVSTGDDQKDVHGGCGQYGEALAAILSRFQTRRGAQATHVTISPTDGWLRMNHFEVEKMLRAQRLYKTIPMMPDIGHCNDLQISPRSECSREVPAVTGIYLRWFEDRTATVMAVYTDSDKTWVRTLYNHEKDKQPPYVVQVWKKPQPEEGVVCWQQVGRTIVPKHLEEFIPVCWHAWLKEKKPQLISFPIIHQSDERLTYQGLHTVVEQPPTDERESGMEVFLTQKNAVRSFRKQQMKDSVHYHRCMQESYKLGAAAADLVKTGNYDKWRPKPESKKPT